MTILGLDRHPKTRNIRPKDYTYHSLVQHARTQKTGLNANQHGLPTQLPPFATRFDQGCEVRLEDWLAANAEMLVGCIAYCTYRSTLSQLMNSD